MSAEFDILVKNSHLIDGSGSGRIRSDIGIRGDRIAAVDTDIPAASAAMVIDGSDQVTCPGFIDTHSHEDFLLFVRPGVEEKTRQGVTTVVIGNCGAAGAPLGENREQYVKGMMGSFGGSQMGDRYKDITSMADFLQQIEAMKPGPNVAALLGHVNLRFSVLGMENRRPAIDELERMKRMALEAMEAGAFGFSTGLIYAPSIYAEIPELAALAGVAGRYGGIYTTHLRSEGDAIIDAMEEAFTIGRKAEIPVHISHHKLTGRDNWGRSTETLERMEMARASGLRVTCDQYPYRAGSTVLTALLPPKYLADPAVFSRLKDADYRRQLSAELQSRSNSSWENMARSTGFDNIIISASESDPELIGRSIAAIAAERGLDDIDAFLELLADGGFDINIILFSMSDTDIERIMQDRYTMIGTDGIPGFGTNKTHPRMTGTFPKILGEYVREKGLLTLEEAIRKMTSLPAETFQIKNRGRIAPQFAADLVIFDPETIAAGSSYDEPHQRPKGISHVLINGQIAVQNGIAVETNHGRVLKRS